MPTIDNTWILIITTLFGGAGLKFIESWLSKKKSKDDQATQIRSELRVEITSLREQLVAARQTEQNLESEVEEWRSKFYDLRDAKTRTETELTLAQAKVDSLQSLVADLKKTITDLEAAIGRLEAIVNKSDTPTGG